MPSTRPYCCRPLLLLLFLLLLPADGHAGSCHRRSNCSSLLKPWFGYELLVCASSCWRGHLSRSPPECAGRLANGQWAQDMTVPISADPRDACACIDNGFLLYEYHIPLHNDITSSRPSAGHPIQSDQRYHAIACQAAAAQWHDVKSLTMCR